MLTTPRCTAAQMSRRPSYHIRAEKLAYLIRQSFLGEIWKANMDKISSIKEGIFTECLPVFAHSALQGFYVVSTLVSTHSAHSLYYLCSSGAWIVKPVASSRGRGIFIVNHPNQVHTGPISVDLIKQKRLKVCNVTNCFKIRSRWMNQWLSENTSTTLF